VIPSISPQKIAFWQARLDAQAQSGLTIAEFCKQQKYSASSFYQWKRKLLNARDSANSSSPATSMANVTNASNFIELVPRQVTAPSAPTPRHAMIEIHLRSGSLIRLPSSNTELLQAAIKSLRDEI
jgi:transposase-like protein